MDLSQENAALREQLAHSADRVIELTTALDSTTAHCNELATQVVRLQQRINEQAGNLRQAGRDYADLKSGVQGKDAKIADLVIEVDRLEGVKRAQDGVIAELRQLLENTPSVHNYLPEIADVVAEFLIVHGFHTMDRDHTAVPARCVLNLLDNLVGSLDFDMKLYNALLDTKLSEYADLDAQGEAMMEAERAAEPDLRNPRDIVEAITQRIRESHPELNIHVVHVRKPG